LGDYAHFKESKVQRKTRENNNQYKRETSSRIQQLKEQFNDRFDGEVNQMREDFEQALIDAHAEIQAAEERMETLIEYERDTMMDEFNENVQEARNYAEQQAQEKANAVRTDLETVTSGHQGMIDDLQSSVMDIDDFIGTNRNITLDQRLLDMTQVFDERINNIREGNYNIIRGSSLDESTVIYLNGMDLITDDRINYVSAWSNSGFPYLRFLENITLEAGKQYTLSFDYRTDKVPEMDGVRMRRIDGTLYDIMDVENHDESNIYELVMDNAWHRAYIRFTPTEN